MSERCAVCGEGPASRVGDSPWLCDKHFWKRLGVVVAAIGETAMGRHRPGCAGWEDCRCFPSREVTRLTAALAAAEARAEKAEARVAELEGEKNAAYRERDQIVALLARMALAAGWTSGLRRHEPDPDPAWDEDWKNVVAIDLPTGQVTWHFHDSERPLFHSLPPYAGAWDGHTTPEKYRRVNSALASKERSR